MLSGPCRDFEQEAAFIRQFVLQNLTDRRSIAFGCRCVFFAHAVRLAPLRARLSRMTSHASKPAGPATKVSTRIGA